MEIGSKLKKARTEQGLTQEQAAAVLGVTRQTISNWENDKSYPDIISVIKMSGLYSVSLDHLLKEDESMNEKQTYMNYLEESTNTVKAARNLEKIVLFSACFLIWAVTEVVFWSIRENMTVTCDVTFRWILLPLMTLMATTVIARNNYWGKANSLGIPAAAFVFLTIPYTQLIGPEHAAAGVTTTVSFVFRWPNFSYMVVGALVALCGLGIGTLLRRRSSR